MKRDMKFLLIAALVGLLAGVAFNYAPDVVNAAIAKYCPHCK